MSKRDSLRCYDEARTAQPQSRLMVKVDSPCLLQVTGVLDLATRDQLDAVLHDLSSPDLHVDVAGLTFADAAGLAVLATAHAERRNRGIGRVVLHGAQPLLERTLQAAGLAGMLPAPEWSVLQAREGWASSEAIPESTLVNTRDR